MSNDSSQVALHMISSDWGIAIDKVKLRNGTIGYQCSTVTLQLGVGLRSHGWAIFATEAEAREEANNEWKIQTDRPARRRGKGLR